MVTNITNLSNVDSIHGIILFDNEITGGLFMTMIMLAVFFILMMRLKPYNTFTETLAYSGFISLIASMFLVFMDLVNPILPIFFTIVFVFAVSFEYLTTR